MCLNKGSSTLSSPSLPCPSTACVTAVTRDVAASPLASSPAPPPLGPTWLEGGRCSLNQTQDKHRTQQMSGQNVNITQPQSV